MRRFHRRAGFVVALAAASVLLSSPVFAARGHRRAGGKPQRHPIARERPVAATRGGLPNVQAAGALVLDENGRQLYAKNPDKERPIASISKLAATLAVVEHGLELDGLSTINKNDIEVAKGGARSRLLDGMTLSNRDLLHAALMGSDNRAIPALGRAAKLTPPQLTAAMNAKVRALGLRNTRFHEPTGLSTANVSTPREVIAMLKAVMANPVLAPITRRAEYDAHPVGKPSLHYNNTNHPAARGNVQVMGGKTGYNDDARYCLVVATRIEGRPYYMAFLGDDGKMTRFGDVARVADWITSHPQKLPPPPKPGGGPSEPIAAAPEPLPIGVAAPEPEVDAGAPEPAPAVQATATTASATAAATPATTVAPP
jgi:serine-type D-Ala-D-Ala endopeptidase (penicillin-binding protein 7)